MALDQALLQLLSILPDSEFEVEKRTCSTGQRLDRDQVLLMIRTRYDNLQRQRNKRGGREDAGHAFVADVGSSGKTLGTVVPREALEDVGVGTEVGVGAGVETEEKRVAKKRTATNSSDSDGYVDGGKGGKARCNRCGEVGYKTVQCLGQVCGVCGGKGHSIYANVAAVFACEAVASGSDGDGGLSGEEQDALVYDAPGMCFDEPGKRGRNALARQMGDLPVICDDGASCRMSH